MKKEKEASPERRKFLKLAALSAPVAAAAVVSTTDDSQAAPVDPLSDRLQDTAHTRAYYDSARF